ncbi:MAG: hypothetical protein AABY16_00315 [Nanoarchaeota archaeon]
MPVLFEIKLSNYKLNGSSSKGRTHGCITRTLREERIEYLARPIRELFSASSTGFVLVIDPYQISKTSPIQQDFRRRRGILVPFYTSRDTYRKIEVPALMREYALSA